MIEYVIPLISSILLQSFLNLWFYPIFALAFLATVPCILRSFFRR